MNYCKTHGTYLHETCPECDLELSQKAIVEGYAIYRYGFALIREALTFSDAARTARGSTTGAGWDIKAWEDRARRYLKETDDRIEQESSADTNPGAKP